MYIPLDVVQEGLKQETMEQERISREGKYDVEPFFTETRGANLDDYI
mgnify:FL=1